MSSSERQRILVRLMARRSSSQLAANMVGALCYLGFVLFATDRAGIEGAAAYGFTLGVTTIYTAAVGGGGRLLTLRAAASSSMQGSAMLIAMTKYRLATAIPLFLSGVVLARWNGIELSTAGLVALAGVGNYLGEPSSGFHAGSGRYGLVGVLTLGQRVLPLALVAVVPGWAAFGAPYLIGSWVTTVVSMVMASEARLSAGSAPAIRDLIGSGSRLAVTSIGDAVQNRGIPLILGLQGAVVAAGLLTPALAVVSAATSVAHVGLQPLIATVGGRTDDIQLTGSAVVYRILGVVAILIGSGTTLALVTLRATHPSVPPELSPLACGLLGVAVTASTLGSYAQVRLTLLHNFSGMASASASGAIMLLVLVPIGFATSGLMGVVLALALAEAARTLVAHVVLRRELR